MRFIKLFYCLLLLFASCDPSFKIESYKYYFEPELSGIEIYFDEGGLEVGHYFYANLMIDCRI